MDDKLMYTPNYIYPQCRLKLLVAKFRHCKFAPANQGLTKVPKILHGIVYKKKLLARDAEVQGKQNWY